MAVLFSHIPIFPPNEPNDSQVKGCEGRKKRRMVEVDLPAFVDGKSAENNYGKRISPQLLPQENNDKEQIDDAVTDKV